MLPSLPLDTKPRNKSKDDPVVKIILLKEKTDYTLNDLQNMCHNLKSRPCSES